MRFKPVLFCLSLIMSSSAFAKDGAGSTNNEHFRGDAPKLDYDEKKQILKDDNDFIIMKKEPLDLGEFKRDFSPEIRQLLDDIMKCDKEKKDVPVGHNLLDAAKIIASRTKASTNANQIVASLIDVSPSTPARDVSEQFKISTSDSYEVLEKLRVLRQSKNTVRLAAAGDKTELPENTDPCIDGLFRRWALSKHFPERGEYFYDYQYDLNKHFGSPPKIQADN